MNATSRVRDLFARIIDYAGTFPPASLSLDDAVAMFARERAGTDAWLLGRFVIGLQHLEAISSTHASVGLDVSRASAAEWPLSVIAGHDARAALAPIEEFNARWRGRFNVASIEFSPMPAEDIANVAHLASDIAEAYFETPLDGNLHARLDAISAARAFAKVRTGGTTPSAIPRSTALADFLYACAQRQLPFKATAGLHHAARSCYPLSYEAESVTAVMYGFLNVVAAAASAAAGENRAHTAEALVEPSAHALMNAALAHDPAATRQFFRSFGSCSFREPADELARIG